MHTDTIRLLGDCTADIRMRVSTIDALLPNIKDHRLRQKLQESVQDHQLLHKHACNLLSRYGGKEKHPNPLAQSMRTIRTGARMAMGGDDTIAAELVADGCDLGVRSLCRSQNRYCMASPDAQILTRELIRCEEALSARLRPYL